MSLDVIFAYVVGVLAGLAVIGALVFVLVWEWCAIRRTLASRRRRAPGEFWRERGAIVSTVPAEGEPIREGARRVLAGESLREIAPDWRSRGSHGQRQP
jgi:hypothetical protein